MSVATHNRTLSKTEYINKIRELNVSVGRIVMNKPKKYRQNYGDAIIKSAIEALKFAQTANSVYVKHDMPISDIALRRTMLIRAKGAVMNVSTISQIFLDLCMSAGGDNTQSYGTGGYGGTQTGNSSGSWSTTAQTNTATSQTDCYSGFGFGGNGIYLSSGYGGAGGGGWYGGTGGCPDGSGDDDRGGGGGSGFIYTSDTASNVPTGWLLTSSYYLTSASTTNGASTITLPSGSTGTGVSDNGYVRITVITITQANNNNIYININGAWKQINQVYENINGTWTI